MKRLLISRPGEGNNILGNRITRVTMGRPIIVGEVKEVNRFSFIFFLRGCLFLMPIMISILGLLESGVWKFLIEIR